MSDLKWVRGNAPAEEGWYRVLHPGDSESIEGHTIYEYGDYQGWAYWAIEREAKSHVVDLPGWSATLRAEAHEASWTCEHDEDGESIIAFCGPIAFPDLPSDLTG